MKVREGYLRQNPNNISSDIQISVGFKLLEHYS